MNHAKVIELRIRNFGPIEALDITPQSSVTEVRGPNATGKSYALNALSCLLEGKKTLPDVPLRNGATKGEIVGIIGEDHDTAMVFRRVLRKNGTELIVTRPNGTTVSRPQEVADALIGNRTIRAKAFCELPEKEQHSMLAEVAGIDLVPLRAKHTEVYDERTVINREVDRLAKAVAEIPADRNVDTELRDVAALTKTLTEGYETRRTNDSTRSRVAYLESQHEESIRHLSRIHADRKSNIEDNWREMSELEKRIDALRAREESQEKEYKGKVSLGKHERDTLQESIERQLEQAEKLVDPDTRTIEQQIAEADTYNEQVRAQRWRKDNEALLVSAERESGRLSDRLEGIKADVAKTIADATMPIKGLAYTTDGVMFKGLPFSQASTAEQLAVSVAIGCVRSPKLRAMTFDDGQALDSAHREKLYKMVHDAGMFVMIAIVDDEPGDGSVRIVEGIRQERKV